MLLLGLAAWLTRRAAGTREPLLPLVTRFAYALVPLGFGVWLAHYGFHLFTGLLTFVPVAQRRPRRARPSAGWERPTGDWAGSRPGTAYPLELGFLGLGLLGSLLVAFRIAEREYPARALRAFPPGPASAFSSGSPRCGCSRSPWRCAALSWRVS